MGKNEKATESTKVVPIKPDGSPVEEKDEINKQTDKTNNDSDNNTTKRKKLGFFSRKRESKEMDLTERLRKTKFKPKDSNLDEEQMDDLHMISTFTGNEIRILHLKFKMMAGERDYVDRNDVMMIPEIRANPLRTRIVELFDVNHDEKIDFREFVSTLSVFSQDGPRDQKLRFAFRMHDFDGDEKISKEDLTKYLQMITEHELTEEEKTIEEVCDTEESMAEKKSLFERLTYNQEKLQTLKEDKKNKDIEGIHRYLNRIKTLEGLLTIKEVVKRTFMEASSDGKYITREDFIRVIGPSDFQGKLTIQI